MISAGNLTDRLKLTLFKHVMGSLSAVLLLSSIQPLPLQAAETDGCYSSFENTDYQDAKAFCQEAAELGDAKAAYLLATIYYQGLSVQADDQRGLFWDEVAADKGYPEAAYRLALAYQLGQGTEQDLQQALHWYMLAARAHHAKAQRNLGAMYEIGAGVEENIEKAYFWYQLSARQGLDDAQLRIGTMLLEGRGVGQDRATAQHWIRKSAQAGNHNAQLALGVILAEIDPADSVHLYQKSADQGNLFAKHNLALVYYTGQGVDVDYPRALQFANEAVDSGNSQVKPLLKQIRLKMQLQIVSDLQAKKARMDALLSSTEIAATEIAATEIAATEIASTEPADRKTNHATGGLIPAGVLSSDMQIKTAAITLPTEPTAAGFSAVKVHDSVVLPANSPYQMKPDGWIMQQPTQRFVIQLANGMDEKGIHKYIRQKELPEGTRYYRTQRGAEVFYILVYGEYESVVQATNAVLQLTVAAQKNHWIRQINTLQKLYRPLTL
ncbi:MAG: hypothetical protein V7731_00045 [Amphritea sp.]